jgi:hypothetical protein
MIDKIETLFRRNLSLCLLIGVASALSAQAPKIHDPNRPVPVSFTLTRRGFELQSIQVPRGYYVFTILNRSPFRGLGLALERMPANSVQGPAASLAFQGKESHSGGRFTRAVQLTPGTYRLRATEIPAWTVMVQVQ